MRENSSRRAVLGSIAGLLAGSAGLAGSASATPDGRLPAEVSGTRIRRFRPDGDRFAVTERFVSPDLKRRYGQRAVKFGTETVPRGAVPESRRDSTEPFEVTGTDTAVIGTFDEHRRAERQLLASTDDVGTNANYTGPLYVYNSSSDNPDAGDLGERTGPINVGWNESLGMDASDIGSHMHSNGWETPWLGTAGTRWIILHYENSTTLYTKQQDTHIGKNYGASWTPDQWHVRAYNLPDHSTDELAVVGQVHRDPQDHDQLPGDTNFHFAESRREVTGDWSDWGNSTSLEYVSNSDQFDSSNGYLGRIDL